MTTTTAASVVLPVHRVKPAPAGSASVPPVRPIAMEPVSIPIVITTTVGNAATSAHRVKPARTEYVQTPVMQAPALMAVVTRVARANRERLAATVGREAPRV